MGNSIDWPGQWEGWRTYELIWSIIGAVVGGSGLVGLLFYFLRRYIEQRLKTVEDDEDKRKAVRVRRMQIEDELHHAYGRVFFWMYRAIDTGSHNGELKSAFEKLQEVEAKKKALDREIIAESEQD